VNTLELERLRAIAGEIEKTDQEIQTDHIAFTSEKSGTHRP